MPISVSSPLPSDSRYREDIIYLKAGDIPAAGEWKHTLEERQRRDARLRKDWDKQQKRTDKKAKKDKKQTAKRDASSQS
jgi:hypothetical protein